VDNTRNDEKKKVMRNTKKKDGISPRRKKTQ
jgi:hypothetical protein